MLVENPLVHVVCCRNETHSSSVKKANTLKMESTLDLYIVHIGDFAKIKLIVFERLRAEELRLKLI